jgi:hypothetical protein
MIADVTTEFLSGMEHRSRSHDAVIRVYNDTGNVIETHEHKGAIRPTSSRYSKRN